ncbi:MAG: hypothetical protein DRG31_05525 [Deltaproteobacteria bacterium]|nr:MAG: hypothetical protein DRG31_05525 [Deltaproteobacteria bacterium]
MKVFLKVFSIMMVVFFLSGGFSLDTVVEEPDPGCEQQERIYQILDSLVPRMKEEYKRRLSELVVLESQRYGYDPELVLAMILVESSFRQRAVSPKKAVGLMQLRPHVAKAIAEELGIPLEEVEELFDPEVNINLGLFYLSKLHAEFKDLELALIAYNYGPTYLRKRLRRGLPLPRRYATRVLRYYQEFAGGS